jgi:hypothetical protein
MMAQLLAGQPRTSNYRKEAISLFPIFFLHLMYAYSVVFVLAANYSGLSLVTKFSLGSGIEI